MAEDKDKQADKDQSSDKSRDGAVKGRVAEAIRSLKFRTNKRIEVEGEPVRFVPDERPMKMADVLSYAEVGGNLVIVSADGRKHRIAA